MAIKHIRDTKVYKLAFDLAMKIFELSKSFPSEEKYSLTDQIRRSGRSVCVCLAEAWRKKQYEAYFVSKVSDPDIENTETQIWLDFALACKYAEEIKYNEFRNQSEKVGRLLNHIIKTPEKY